MARIEHLSIISLFFFASELTRNQAIHKIHPKSLLRHCNLILQFILFAIIILMSIYFDRFH